MTRANSFDRWSLIELSFAALFLYSTLCFAQTAPALRTPAAGLVWRVQGDWKDVERGTPIRFADAIREGALLEPITLQAPHSITMLLPDGQRVLSECFTAEDCSRGVRVPSLPAYPSAFNMEMLNSMRAVLAQRDGLLNRPSAQAHTTSAKKDEFVATIATNLLAGPSAKATTAVEIGSVLSDLPSGNYHYDLRPLDHMHGIQSHLPLNKTSSACSIPVPAPGLYEIAIWDSLELERIDLVLAAVTPQDAQTRLNFIRAQKVLRQWDEQYYGWPIHILLRAYLQSMVEHRANG